MHTLIHTLSAHLASTHVGTLIASLGWVHMLLRKSASRVMQLSAQIWPALFNCLSNPSEEVVRLDIEALAHMASSTQQVSQPHNAAVSSSPTTTTTHHHTTLSPHTLPFSPCAQHFGPFIEHLLRLFREERPLLEARGTLIVRQLCELLEPRQVFVTLAASLQHEEDLAFASQMVQTLNLILLTSTEAWELRLMLKQVRACLCASVATSHTHSMALSLSLECSNRSPTRLLPPLGRTASL